jgi:hypothetical protein
MLADLIAWGFWADVNGHVWFTERKPFPDGDTSVATIPNTELISLSTWKSDKNLRNRVVVWGSAGVYAEAHATSPYLPSGFFKTAAASAPGIIDNQASAQAAANYNLALYNRLTQGYNATIIGNPAITARKVVHLDYTDEDLYVYGCEHSWSAAGYLCNLDLRKE